MPYFYYLRPDLTVNAYLASAPSVTGTVETDYEADWLVDGQGGRPVRTTSGAASFTVDHAAQDVNFVGLVNHNIDAGINVTIGGDLSTTIVSTGPLKNPFSFFTTVVGCNQVTLSLTGNTADVIIGELVIGKVLELERPIIPGGRRVFPRANEERGGIYNSLATYDYGVRRNNLTASTTCTQDGLDAIDEWYAATKDQALFTAIVPTPSINDFILATWKSYEYSKRGPQWFEVNFQFEETRVQW